MNARVRTILVLIGLVTVVCSGTANAVVLNASADHGLGHRSDQLGDNNGGYWAMKIGYDDGAADDWFDNVVRFDLSAYAGQVATGPGTFTIYKVVGRNITAFNGYTVDLYKMPAINADWVEGVGGSGTNNSTVPGSAFNRKQGAYTLTPPDSDKWLPVATNSPEYGKVMVDSHTYLDSEGTAPINFTVSQAVLNQAISEGSMSFLLRSDSAIAEAQSGGWNGTGRFWPMATRENGHASQLTFDAVQAPEPTTLVMLVTGGLLVFGWRRTRRQLGK